MREAPESGRPARCSSSDAGLTGLVARNGATAAVPAAAVSMPQRLARVANIGPPRQRGKP